MRLIDADALIDKTDDRYSLHEIGRRERDDIVDALEYAPTIQPEVVRCEECKYHHQKNCPIEKYFSLDGFCSRGKR